MTVCSHEVRSEPHHEAAGLPAVHGQGLAAQPEVLLLSMRDGARGVAAPYAEVGSVNPEPRTLDDLWARLWDDLRHNATGKPSGEAIIARHRPAIEAEARADTARPVEPRPVHVDTNLTAEDREWIGFPSDGRKESAATIAQLEAQVAVLRETLDEWLTATEDGTGLDGIRERSQRVVRDASQAASEYLERVKRDAVEEAMAADTPERAASRQHLDNLAQAAIIRDYLAGEDAEKALAGALHIGALFPYCSPVPSASHMERHRVTARAILQAWLERLP